MKVFLILFLWMASVITGNVMAQQKPYGVTLKTTKKGDPNPYEPAPDSERFKMNCVAKKDTTAFFMYLREYVDGEKVYNESERIISGRDKKGHKFSWEVVPDVSAENILRVYVYVPGFTAHRMKASVKGKSFNYVPYRLKDDTGQTEDVPLMLFYEDDTETHEMKTLVQKHTIDGKLDPDATKNKALLAKIKRYAILTYTLN
jgi:hypothetical protein